MRSLRRCSLFALLPLLSHCTDAPTELDLESPILQIVSGAGSPSGHFYFLPPIAAGTGFSGTFDDELLSQLQIRVCALSSGATPACIGGDIVSLSSSTSPAIVLDAIGENYSVNWSTKKGGLSTSINYRIRVFAGTVLLGFADLDLVTNKKQLTSVPAGFVGLVKNGSLVIKFRVEAGIVGSVVVSPATATITSSGSQQFTATVTDLHGAAIASPTLLWSSSNTDAATVDQTGLASGVAAGSTTIKAVSQGVEGTAALTVQSVSEELQATDDGYTATGNIAIAIADGTADVLNNDQGTGTLTVSEVQGSSANVGVATNTTASGIGSITGKVTLNADGSFTYDPPPGYTGTDQFTYRITDGNSSSNQATVTITVSDMMWFVCDACGGNNRGTLTDPFTSVAAFTTANTGAAPAPQPNHKLYIRSGTYDGAGDNLALRDGQLAFGQGVAASTIFTPDANSVPAYAGLTAGTAPVIAPTSGNGVNLASGNTLRGFDLGSAGGIAIAGSNFGALTVTTISINTTGAALDLNTGSASATGVTFGSITSSGGTNNIKLANLGGTNAFALGSGALSGASGNAFDVDNGTAPISYSGTIASTAARPVRVENYDGGTIALSGAVSGTSSGVLLNANTGATIAFSGGLSLSTGPNPAFTATGGGTVTATQNNTSIVNTLATTTGTALNVQNTTIGAAGLTFRSISANGAANGVVLNSTGSSGGLTVTGNGGTCTNADTSGCSGGTIQNTTGADDGGTTPAGTGIVLNSTSSVSLTRMWIHDHSNYGIRGTSVAGFALANSVLNGTNGGSTAASAAAPFHDGTIKFDNLTGSATISDSYISGGFSNNVRIENTTSTLDRITFSNDSIGPNSTTSGQDGILLQTGGTAGVIKATVQNTTFTSARGQLFNFVSSASGTTADDLVFSNNTLSNNHPGLGTTFTGGTTISSNGAKDVTFQVTDNSFRDAAGDAVAIVKSIGAGTLSGTFGTNTIGVAAVANSGSLVGSGLSVRNVGQGTLTISITNNQIRQYNSFGVLLQAGGTTAQSGAFNATITGNTISNPGNNLDASVLNGLQVNGGTTTGDTFQICTQIGGSGALANAIAGSGGNQAELTDFRLRQRQSTTIRLPGYGGGATDAVAVVSFVGFNNGGTPSGSATVSGSGGGFVGGAACPQP